MTDVTTTAQYTQTVSDALRESWGHVRHGEKLLAARIGTNVRTARNWLLGENAPDGARLIELIKRDDAVFRAVMELAERPLPAALSSNDRRIISDALRLLEGSNERDGLGGSDELARGLD